MWRKTFESPSMCPHPIGQGHLTKSNATMKWVSKVKESCIQQQFMVVATSYNHPVLSLHILECCNIGSEALSRSVKIQEYSTRKYSLLSFLTKKNFFDLLSWECKLAWTIKDTTETFLIWRLRAKYLSMLKFQSWSAFSREGGWATLAHLTLLSPVLK